MRSTCAGCVLAIAVISFPPMDQPPDEPWQCQAVHQAAQVFGQRDGIGTAPSPRLALPRRA